MKTKNNSFLTTQSVNDFITVGTFIDADSSDEVIIGGVQSTVHQGGGTITSDSGNDGRFRPCEHRHVKYHFDTFNGEKFKAAAPAARQFFLSGRVATAIQQEFPLRYIEKEQLSDRTWFDLDTIASNAMLPTLSSGFSFINFLVELKDFRQVTEAFHKRRGRLEASVTGSSTAEGLFQSATKHPLSTLSRMFLNYNFALRPFADDLKKAWLALQSLESRLAELENREGKPQTRHYSATVSEETVPVSYSPSAETTEVLFDRTDFGSPNRRNVVTILDKHTSVSKYHATMRFTYTLPGSPGLRRIIRGYLDAFGVRLDPSIVWNAIPFSFITDWFRDVGGFLRRFGVDNLQATTVIEDFCSTVRTSSSSTRELRFSHSDSPVSPLYGHTDIPIASLEHVHYRRRVSIPDLIGLVSSSDYSIKEIALSGALLSAGRGSDGATYRVPSTNS